MNKKFIFKLDKDKIKLQLKDLGKKFTRKKGGVRNAILIFVFFIILGVAFVLNNNGQDKINNNFSSNQNTAETQNLELNYGEERASFYINHEAENDFSLNYPGIKDKQNIGESYSLREEESTVKDSKEEEIEGVVTESVRPISAVQQDEWDLELLRPVSGEIIQNSGWYYHPVLNDWRYQNGLEFSGNSGDIVMAAAEGETSTVLEDNYKGIMVLIEHENGWVTEYGHLQRAMVSPGERVSKGQEIGRIGVTGMSSQPSLYFSLKNQDGSIDPLAYFE